MEILPDTAFLRTPLATYRYPLWGAAVAALISVGITAFLLWLGYDQEANLGGKGPFPRVIAWGAAFWLGIFALFAVNDLRRRLQKGNWLVRMFADGIQVNLRSYLNAHLPPEEETTVFLPFSDLQWVQLERGWDRMPGSRQGRVMQRHRTAVRLKLAPFSGDLEALAAALARGRQRRPGKGLFLHFPVQLQDGVLEIEWRVRPKAARFVEELGRRGIAAKVGKGGTDYLALRTAVPEEQEQGLRELVAAGDEITAIKLAREWYGLDLAQAKEKIEKLR